MSATAALPAAAVATYAASGSDRFTQLTIALAIVGLALTIIAGQLPNLFGVEKGSGDIFQKIWDLITKLGDTSGLTLLVGLVSLAIVSTPACRR